MAEDHPFFLAAQDNDLHQWVPESPVQMYYCTQDEQVFYDNALVAEAWMTENGAAQITTVDGGPLNHGQCALLAILGGTVWINAQADLCNPTAVSETAVPALTWRPEAGQVQVEGLRTGQGWSLYALDGRLLDRGVARTNPLRLTAPGGLSVLVADDGRNVRFAQD